jgi:hypothetical protein
MVEGAAKAHYPRQVRPLQLAPSFISSGRPTSGLAVSRGAYWRYDRQGADNDSFRLPEMRADLPSYPKAPARWGRTV